MKLQRGFTIVELLIVIVIIAILAAFIVISYNGIQLRAENSKTTTAVQAYKKALLQYAVENNAYPSIPYSVCLGENYPDAIGAGANKCAGAQYPVSENTTFNNAIRKYFAGGKIPLPSLKKQMRSSYGFVGAFFVTDSAMKLNGQSQPWWIVYMYLGNQAKCPIGPVYRSVSPNWSVYLFPEVTYTNQNGTDGVECYMPLPDPKTL